MNLWDFKNKLIKGKELGGEVVYIKEDNLLYGIESIYKNHEVNSISLLKSEQNSIKVHDLIEFLERECDDFYEGDVFIGNTINYRENKLKVEVNKDGVNITNLEGNDIEINVYDKKYIVKNKEYIDNKDVALN